MSKLSQEIPEEITAIELLSTLETEKDVRDFIKGDDRDSVMDAAVARINELNKLPLHPEGEGGGEGADSQSGALKQGEEPGLLTKLTNVFKGSSVEGTKGSDNPIAGDDVIDALDEVAAQKAEDILKQDVAVEAKNEQEAAAKPKAHVTCEDVIARMRAEGKKI